jgi:hypothetical protein
MDMAVEYVRRIEGAKPQVVRTEALALNDGPLLDQDVLVRKFGHVLPLLGVDRA